MFPVNYLWRLAPSDASETYPTQWWCQPGQFPKKRSIAEKVGQFCPVRQAIHNQGVKCSNNPSSSRDSYLMHHSISLATDSKGIKYILSCFGHNPTVQQCVHYKPWIASEKSVMGLAQRHVQTTTVVRQCVRSISTFVPPVSYWQTDF